MLIGSFGLFFTLFLLFCRFLPVVAMAEVKTVMPQAHAHHDDEADGIHHDLHKSDFQPDEHFRPTEGQCARRCEEMSLDACSKDDLMMTA